MFWLAALYPLHLRPQKIRVDKVAAYQIEEISLKMKIKDLLALGKIRRSFSVVFSAIAGYLIATPGVHVMDLLNLALGGILVVTASNGFNQIIEKEPDKLMKRTKNRPLPTERMSVTTAMVIGVIFTIFGLAILYTINPKTAIFWAISIFVYISV